ncbi:beta-N-acetylhexosaminidase [Paenarthrobacter nitroguajacolicus]|uniref:glycoside hydrolase family 3 protein n=1 Tax=Paenarthrobacter nitroguajacolicus TaxID=211146 RepID=UPI0028644AB1|nr:glycoside hydrolase family 3 N-terminal domain-containing protein [Paenarthrobacter nitroguajacolicus]MDR6988461.1 beta-N-acetylhexosaminidase [Paenarthrobacter nitroguajacolicus]
MLRKGTALLTAATTALLMTTAGTAVAAVPTTTARTTTVTASPDIEAMIAGMSLDQKIGQMTWTHVYGSSADDTSMAASNQARYGVNTPAEVVEKYNLGGVLYFAWSGNTANPQQVAGLSNGLQQAAVGADGKGIPLAVTIDQEGGLVARIGAPATVLPGNMALGATTDADLARAQGEILGSEMRAMGINVDFAPVLDLNSNPDNPVIGIRSMGEDPALVSKLGVAQIDGMQAHDVGAAAKHFPGHGDTSVDSHYGLPTVTYDRETLNQHLKPFKAAIDGGVDMVMTAHIIVEAIDPDMPGTLSHKVLTGLLRDELGFKGLVTTDALDMAAMAAEWPQEEIAVKAIQAGSDILLNSPDVDASFAGVRAAVESGEINESRLDESVRRILEWKVKRGVFEQPMADPANVDKIVGTAGNLATANLISDRAVTLLRNQDRVLPLAAGSSVLMVGAGSGWPETAGPLLKEQGFTVTEDYESGSSPSAAYRARAVAAADDVDAVVFTSYNATANAAQQQMVAALAATGTPVIVIATRNPYDISVFPGADAVLNSYGINRVNFHGAVRAISGAVNPGGKLPVNIPEADGDGVLLPLGFGLHYDTATPAAVTFTDRPGKGQDAYTIPAAAGVVYLIDGREVAAGTYRKPEGTVTVTAAPGRGFVFTEGAVTQWSHTFTTGLPKP